jgi:argininosuccinate lyase
MFVGTSNSVQSPSAQNRTTNNWSPSRMYELFEKGVHNCTASENVGLRIKTAPSRNDIYAVSMNMLYCEGNQDANQEND